MIMISITIGSLKKIFPKAKKIDWKKRKLGKESCVSSLQHCSDKLEYLEESWRSGLICFHSYFGKKHQVIMVRKIGRV